MKRRHGGTPTSAAELLSVLQSMRPSRDPRERLSATHQEELFAIAPAWFDRRERAIMRYGFSCGEGWFPLLRDLLSAIKPLAPAGFSVDQVKQKFGELCIYVSGETPEIEALIEDAIVASRRTCEWCGAPAELEHPRRYSWVMTLCPACSAQRLKTERPGFS